MISRDHAFRLQYTIHPYVQNAIIENVVSDGYTFDAQPFWLKYDVRSIEYAHWYINMDQTTLDFHHRLDPDAHWYWETNDVADLVRPIVADVEHLFTKMTRIKVFIQKPGEEIAAHRDLVPGNDYRLISSPTKASLGGWSGTYIGDEKLGYVAKPNTRHSDQKYLTLKIPLSSNPTTGGKPYIVASDGVKKYLRAEDNYYFLNEYEIFHGCDAVDFYRGVIFVDGILNMEAIEAEPKLDF